MEIRDETSRKNGQSLRIYEDDQLRGTPAAVDRREGIIYINPRSFYRLTDFEQKFVLLHEEAHYHLDTSDEVACDTYAFEHLAGTEFKSLKQSISTLDRILKKGNHTRAERLYNLYLRALEWDGLNGNKRATKEHERLKNQSVLDAVSGCEERGWWIFKQNYCKTDPTGDAKAKAEASYTLAQAEQMRVLSEQIKQLTSVQADEKKGQAERNQKMVMFAVVAFVVMIFFWK